MSRFLFRLCAWPPCLALLLCAAAAHGAVAAPTDLPADPHADSALPGAGLVADVEVMRQAYTALHPGLYRYVGEAEMARRFDALRETLRGGATLGQAYLAFSRFTAGIRCGHTYPNFANQPEPIRHALFEHEGLLPFQFVWLDRRMVVTRDGSVPVRLPRGTQVLAIDGVPVGRILAALMQVARADGSNDAKRVAQMQIQGRERTEAFDVYLPLLFPQIGRNPLLRVQLPGESAARTLRVQGFTPAQRSAMASVRERDSNAPAWTIRMQTPQLAVLNMPDWALYDSAWDWRGFLDSTFADLDTRQVPALVIDLRGNEGGLGEVGDALLAHLTEQPLQLPQIRQLVRYRRVPDALAPYLTTWDASFRDWGDAAQAYDGRYYTLTRWQPATASAAIQPQAPHYRGKVFVLIGADNSSATFGFANQVKASGLATLVGQSSGGNRRGINGSAFFFLHLPHSGIELDLPLVGQYPADPQPDAGIAPDVAVAPSIADIAAGRDVEMAAVMRTLAAPASLRSGKAP
ncbi:S41 family peptidase [Xanthomonas bonasiae]|uniref:S41 family peptidase n=1 Tax=Xanthomonas bonasiae TaxID=2810351 RepID=UPI0019811C7D|nr:S41 family peptidase [Xanthomonas bonasiae]MBN6110208.1 peptidase S41 [Xanthomonas bonasiae]